VSSINREPAYVLEANIRRYRRLLADPNTPQATRDVVAKLLVEMRERLQTQIAEERELERMAH
jgi:hypothetical protein